MNTLKIDLKFDKLKQLSDIFKNEEIEDKGIYHIQRNISETSTDNILLIASYDIKDVFNNFSEGKITYASLIERESLKVLSLTIRLESGSILKYVLTSNTGLSPRLRFNFSVNTRVIEYDDASPYLNTTLKNEKETRLEITSEIKEVLNIIKEAVYD